MQKKIPAFSKPPQKIYFCDFLKHSFFENSDRKNEKKIAVVHNQKHQADFPLHDLDSASLLAKEF